MVIHLSKKRKLASLQADRNFNKWRRMPNCELGEPPQSGLNDVQKGAQIQPLSSVLDHKTQRHASSAIYMEGAHHDYLSKLKIDELSSQVRPSPSRIEKADGALRRLKRVIEAIPNRDALAVSEAIQLQEKVHAVRIPFPEPPPDKDVKYKLTYSKPSRIYEAGSYARRTAVTTGNPLTIDLAVEMPSHIFQEKDFLDYRYFHKRAYYLSCIAMGIEKSMGSQFRLKFTCQNDSTLQPTIIILPLATKDRNTSDTRKYQIQIILAASATIFPLSKTLPSKNCVRTRDTSQDSSRPSEATPFYNAVLRSECSSLAFVKFLHGPSLRLSAFNDACVLGSVWLGQRGFGSNLTAGGFGQFEWACSMALLLYGGGKNGNPVLSEGYSHYQLFKAMLQYFASKDLTKYPNFVFADPFHIDTNQMPVFFDGTRGLNILFKMSTWSYHSLRHAASTTIKLLADPLEDHFGSCFIKRLDIPTFRFDYIVRLAVSQVDLLDASQPDAVDSLTRLCHRIYWIFNKGLGDRVVLIDLKHCGVDSWDIDASRSQNKTSNKIQLGLLVDADRVDRGVEKGPSIEDKESAAAFREFWGEKSELRRFKDGSILESITWSPSNAITNVLSEIIYYLIRRHLDEIVERVDIFAGDEASSTLSTSTMSLSQSPIAFFETLEKQIRGLEGLPLKIRQVSAADIKLRYTAPPTSFISTPESQMNPIQVCVQFEGSKRWPDDFTAVQRTKIAFLLKMGEGLEHSSSVAITRVGLENTSDILSNIAFLDVTYHGGMAFRIRIHHEREQVLIEQERENTSKATMEREAAASALSTYKRDFLQASLHTQAVRKLSTRFPPLARSISLVKIWRDCHLLSDHITDELIELLTIRTFVHSGSYSIPGSPMTGFLRTLLFVSKWDWRTEPFITDMSGDMSISGIEAIRMRFQAWRKLDPAMNKIALFAASDVNPSGITWTEKVPSKTVAAHFTGLARAAINLVKEQNLGLQIKTLFVPSLADYDFIIHLDRRIAYQRQQQEARLSEFKNLREAAFDRNHVDFRPIDFFLEELRGLYGSNLVFFFNKDGGDAIGGLWHPLTSPRPWKVTSGFSTVPIDREHEDSERIEINRIATLNDIARLGGDLIQQIDIKR